MKLLRVKCPQTHTIPHLLHNAGLLVACGKVECSQYSLCILSHTRVSIKDEHCKEFGSMQSWAGLPVIQVSQQTRKDVVEAALYQAATPNTRTNL